jgi:hypothetical protein
VRLVDDEAMTGACFHCRAPCTEEDYCFGCETFVCALCSPYYDGPGGAGHTPAEHLLYLGTVCDPALDERLAGRPLTCRRIVGGTDDAPVLCGRPAALSAYCREHLHAVIDERLSAP